MAQDGLVDVSALLERWAGEQPSKTALTIDDDAWTYEQLWRLARRAASHLHAIGTRPGDIVALPLPNSVEQTALFFGAWQLGAAPLPLPPTMPDAELTAVLRAADTDLVVRAGQSFANAPLWSGERHTSAVFKAQATGGSTGVPKIILDTRPSMIDPAFDFMGWTLGEALFLPGPTYHSGPMSHLVEGLARGKHVVFMRKFDAGRALELIARHRPHFALFVPTMMQRIMQLPEELRRRTDMSSLKRVWHTASPCPPDLKRKWIDWIGGDVIWEMFGGSEAVALTIITGSEWLGHPGSVGRVTSGEIRILDEEGRPVPTGEIGEIYLRSAEPSPMRYAGTVARRMQGDWESFGDLGRFDEDGYLYLADRRRDMIITGGQNVYPAEVEAALMNFPGVADAAVFGQPDDDLGEMVCALVCPSEGTVDEAALRRHLARSLTRYKIPRRIGTTDEPIRNDAGKLRRSELRL
jgi:bile acid-coenzyme A ligase